MPWSGKGERSGDNWRQWGLDRPVEGQDTVAPPLLGVNLPLRPSLTPRPSSRSGSGGDSSFRSSVVHTSRPEDGLKAAEVHPRLPWVTSGLRPDEGGEEPGLGIGHQPSA